MQQATAVPQSDPAGQVAETAPPAADAAPAPAAQVVQKSAGQELTGNLFRDDFETAYMGWDYGSDEEAEWGYDNGAYLMRIKLSDQPLSFSPPVTDFTPTAYEFDAAASGQPGDDGTGTFGVLCDYSPASASNYVAVEIDPYNQVFLITQFIDSQPGASSGVVNHPGLRPNPGDVNHLLVECQWQSVTLFINNEWAAVLELDQPMDGGMALFIANWGPTSPNFFQVLVDNFNAWVPVQ